MNHPITSLNVYQLLRIWLFAAALILTGCDPQESLGPDAGEQPISSGGTTTAVSEDKELRDFAKDLCRRSAAQALISDMFDVSSHVTECRKALEQFFSTLPTLSFVLPDLMESGASSIERTLTSVGAQDASTNVFSYTGTDQMWTVPAGVTQITVKAWGAGGAGGNYINNDIGGGGGFVTGTLAVTPGEQLTVIVGGGGQPGAGPGAYGGGGGKACGSGGRGGGRSAIRNASGTELITAGAGGGGGGSATATEARGGGGGGLSGTPSTWPGLNGEPGTQTAGGAGGSNPNFPGADGSPGGQFFGGGAGCYDNGYNGSGGSGYFGGGGGTDVGDGGGGGGSSFVPSGGSTVAASDAIPGNSSDPNYADNAGHGGPKGGAGRPGRAVILATTSVITITEEEFTAELRRMANFLFSSLENPYHLVAPGFDSKWHNPPRNNQTFSFRGQILRGTELNYYFQGWLAREYGFSQRESVWIAALWRRRHGESLGDNREWAVIAGYQDTRFGVEDQFVQKGLEKLGRKAADVLVEMMDSSPAP